LNVKTLLSKRASARSFFTSFFRHCLILRHGNSTYQPSDCFSGCSKRNSKARFGDSDSRSIQVREHSLL